MSRMYCLMKLKQGPSSIFPADMTVTVVEIDVAASQG